MLSAERNLNNYLESMLPIVTRASEAIMAVYNQTGKLKVEYKDDDSPLTKADKTAHKIIVDGLARAFPDTPIISEEADESTNRTNIGAEEFWVVDPLDGTKEFIKKNGQFTVCIALVRAGRPIFGIVAAPALGDVYYGGTDMGSFVRRANGGVRALHVAETATNIIFGSISHPNETTNAYNIQHFPGATIKECGSQLKIVLVAAAEGDAYVRLGTTMRIWDTAAGHAILEGAGGWLARPDGTPIDYRMSNLYIGDFVASRQKIV